MAVLALDLGWSLGWCLWRRGDVVESGVKKMADVSAQDGVRLLAFRLFLTNRREALIDLGETLDDVVFERIDFLAKENGLYWAHLYGALWGNLESWSAFYGIPCRGIAWNVIKKHVTGHGSAAKSLVTKRVQELYPHVKQADEADAVAVLLTAQNKFGKGSA